MKNTSSFLISLALITSFSFETLAGTPQCIGYYKESAARSSANRAQFLARQQEIKDYFAYLVDIDLTQHKSHEIRQVAAGVKYRGTPNIVMNAAIDALIATKGKRRWSTQEIIAELNEQTLRLLEEFRPDDLSDKRFDHLPLAGLDLNLMQAIERHPVISSWGNRKYQREGVEIGYCFGVGTCMDMMLMRIGIDRDATKKIWAVGSMSAGNISWGFHIGQVARNASKTWSVIDHVPSYYEILSPRGWAQHFKNQNHDGTLRIYITDSDKFTPSLSEYDRVQMGLNLSRERDYYRHFFVDLITYFKTTSDADIAEILRIAKLPDRPIPVNPTERQKAISRAEEEAFSQLPPQSLESSPQSAAHSKLSDERRKNVIDHIKAIGKRLGIDLND